MVQEGKQMHTHTEYKIPSHTTFSTLSTTVDKISRDLSWQQQQQLQQQQQHI